MSFDKLIQYQKEYSEKYPDDEFNALNYFQSLGVDGLIDIFKESKGRQITLKMSDDDDDEQLINVEYK
jgi:hypothetical protein